jgi:hypothetical protein
LNELLRLTGDVVNFVIRFKVDFSIAEAVTLLGDDEGDVDFLSFSRVVGEVGDATGTGTLCLAN